MTPFSVTHASLKIRRMKTPVTPSFYVQDDSAEPANPNSSLFRGVRDIVQLEGEKRGMEYERYGWGFLVCFFPGGHSCSSRLIWVTVTLHDRAAG